MSRGEPPADVPGVVEVVLDPGGGLLRYLAAPPPFEEAGREWPEPDWSRLFHEAALVQGSVPRNYARPRFR